MSTGMACTACGRELGEGDRFCPGCGATVVDPLDTATGGPAPDQGTDPTQCVKCSAPMGRDDRFCPKCGAPRPEDATVVSHVSLRNAQAAHLIEATEGEFEILQQLGTGAMGAVYLAKDMALGRNVAIKVIAPNLLSDATMISRFRLEAQTVASLRHRNIVNVHAVRQSDDLHFFVMEFIDGPPLRSIVKGHAPLDVDVVQALLFQVGSALSYAHRTGGGVIHRDIKPANIMVDREGDAFVTDFGISKIAEAQTGLTQTGATIGTPEYMSPEQCRGEALTGASDQYALGIVAYEMLCGQTPFSGSQYYIMVAHTSEAPEQIRELRPDCPPQVANAVERMLAKTPDERWPDLDSAVAAMGGAPLPYKSPVRAKIVALTGATLVNMPVVGTGSGAGTGAETLDTATSVTVTGLPPVIETGDTFTLEADVRGTGEVSLGGQGVIWASTDPSIARVAGGVVEALRPGTVSITATAGNVANSVLLTVAEPSPAAVLVRPGSVRIQRGGRIGLAAVVQDRKGREMDLPVTWRTSDAAVATVTEEGQVVATGPGTVSIVAETEGATGTAEVVVEAPAAAPAEETLVVSPTTTGGAAAVPAKPAASTPATTDGPAAPPEAPDRTKPTRPVTEPPKPSYDQPGPLYRRPAAIAAAVALLFAIGFGIVSMGGDDAPQVADPAAGGVAAPEPLPGVTAAGPAGPAAEADGGGDPDAPADADIDAEAAPTPEPEPVDAGPTSTAAADPPPPDDPPPSTTTPPAAATPTPAATTPPTPASVQIELASTEMAIGGTSNASAQVFTAGGSRMTSGFNLVWRSSNGGVVSVDSRGSVRATGAGTAWVVASAASARDSVRVTVSTVVDAVRIAGSDFTLVEGGSRTLSASAVDPQGNVLERGITWRSSDQGIVTVDAATGSVTAAGPGTAQVIATADGVTGSVSVTVEATSALPSPTAVQAALEGYVASLSGGDEEAVRRYWGSDQDGLDELIDLMGEVGFSASLVSVADPAEAGAAAARVGFTVAAAWRSSFGGNRDRQLTFVARLERSGSGWSLASAVVQ